MTWESSQGWQLGRAREPSRLPEQLPQLTIDPGGSSRRCRQSLSKERRRFWVGFLALFRGFSQISWPSPSAIRHTGQEAAPALGDTSPG
jgi:hypothetical protein